MKKAEKTQSKAPVYRTIKVRSGKLPIGIWVLVIMSLGLILYSYLAPYLYPIDLGDTNLKDRLLDPSIFGLSDSGYLLGTDALGRDVAVRLLYAIRASISLATVGLLSSVVLGLTVGILAGICGGWVDDVVMFMINVRHSLPSIIRGMAVSTIFGFGTGIVILMTTLIYWSGFARQTRAGVIQLKKENFIECSRAIGASTIRIIFEHIIKNIASPLIVTFTNNIGAVILFESSLSFLGFGIQPPHASLGTMVNNGRALMVTQWWQSLIPTMVIVLFCVTASLFGDWLRDRLDPKRKQK